MYCTIDNRYDVEPAVHCTLQYLWCHILWDQCHGTVNAQLIKHALKAGMQEGETAAAQANCRAAMMLVFPSLYGGVYNACRNGRVPGAPYLLCIALMLASTLASTAAGAVAMGDEKEVSSVQ